MWVIEWSSGCRILIHFQRHRAESVGEYFALPVEVGYCGLLLNVLHHARTAHAKAPIEPTTAPSVCQHGEEIVLVNVVVTFAQTFRAILVGGTSSRSCCTNRRIRVCTILP